MKEGEKEGLENEGTRDVGGSNRVAKEMMETRNGERERRTQKRTANGKCQWYTAKQRCSRGGRTKETQTKKGTKEGRGYVPGSWERRSRSSYSDSRDDGRLLLLLLLAGAVCWSHLWEGKGGGGSQRD